MANAISVVRAQGETLDCRLGGLRGLGTRDLPGLVSLGGELRDVQHTIFASRLFHAKAHAEHGVLVDEVVRLGGLHCLDSDVELSNERGQVLRGSLARLEETGELRGGVLLQDLVVGGRDDLGRVPDVRIETLSAQGLLYDRLNQERADLLLGTDEMECQMIDRPGVLTEVTTHPGRLQLSGRTVSLQEEMLLDDRREGSDDLRGGTTLSGGSLGRMSHAVSSGYGGDTDRNSIGDSSYGCLGQSRDGN